MDNTKLKEKYSNRDVTINTVLQSAIDEAYNLGKESAEQSSIREGVIKELTELKAHFKKMETEAGWSVENRLKRGEDWRLAKAAKEAHGYAVSWINERIKAINK